MGQRFFSTRTTSTQVCNQQGATVGSASPDVRESRRHLPSEAIESRTKQGAQKLSYKNSEIIRKENNLWLWEEWAHKIYKILVSAAFAPLLLATPCCAEV